MTIANIKVIINSNINKVWECVLDVENYSKWRSDLSKVEKVNEKQFIEYTNEGYQTKFTVTYFKECNRWEFDMENTNIKGHWTGIFTAKDESKTQIEFTEQITAKKFIMKPFVKGYLKKQQAQFVADLKKMIEK